MSYLDVFSGVETASHAGHCPINLVNVRWIETVYKVYWEQDKSDEKKSKCLAVGSKFPHPGYICQEMVKEINESYAH